MYIRKEDGVFAAEEHEGGDGHFGSLSSRIMLDQVKPASTFSTLPFDYYCSSVYPALAKRVCNRCELYFCSAKSLKQHRRAKCAVASDAEDSDDETVIDDTDYDHSEFVPIFSLDKYLNPVFTDDI